MGLIQTLGTGQGFLKGGFQGFNKSGKTYTSVLLAAGTREHFGLEGPIAMFDTEGGAEYVAPLVKRLTGKDLVGVRSRSFDDLCAMGEECITAGVSVLIADSMTHVWRELCAACLKQVNDDIKRKNERGGRKRPLRRKLEFQDWAFVKDIWGRWADFYLNAPLHIIICGRAGYEYDMEKDEDTGQKELVKTGIKMKTEGEFGFEPSLLVQMDREQEPDGSGGFVIRRRATVIGDRFGVIDGATTMDPTFEFFAPHVHMLKAGAVATVDVTVKTDMGDVTGDEEWMREKKARVILCEKIQGELIAKWPGQKAEEKKAKSDLLAEVFRTRSWTQIESMESDVLQVGLARIRATLGISTPTGDPIAAEIADQESDLSFAAGAD